MATNEKTFADLYWDNFTKSVYGTFTPGGAVATSLGAYIGITNKIFENLVGKTLTFKVVAFGRELEAVGISYATGSRDADWSGVAGAVAGIVAGIAIEAVAAPTVGGAVVAFVAASLADAAMDALVDTINQKYPDWPSDIASNIKTSVDGLLQDISSNVSKVEDLLTEWTKDEWSDFVDGIGELIDDAENSFSSAIQAQLRRLLDPIVVDLDGDGVELVARAESAVYFDMDGDGIAELTGWVGKDDGLLAIDENGNGKIDDIDELIGDLGRSGFTELKTYDGNADGVIDSKDAAYSKLRVWVDADTDGVTDAGELRTLAQAGITAIDLNYTTVSFTAEGNRIHEQATFEKSNGTSGTIVDAWFDVSNVTTSAETATTGNATIDALPDIRGYGDVESLHSAMLSDGALTSLVSSVAGLRLDQLGGLRATVENILYRWAGTSAISATSRGDFFDGRKLATLEAFLGTEYSVNGVSNPTAAAVANLEASWAALVDGVMARLLIAGPLASVLPEVTYLESIDYILTIGSTTDLLKELTANAPASGDVASADYWTSMSVVLKEIAESAGSDTDSAAYRAAVADALEPHGLSAMIDVLGGGVTPVAAGVRRLADAGIFAGATGSDSIVLTGETQAFYGRSGNDRVSSAETNAAKALFGGTGTDVLQSSNGADWLDGGSGGDTMYGGRGDDTYVVDDPADRVVESTDSGNDTIRTTLTYTLATDLENLVLLGTAAIAGIGNAADNRITGNAAANVLEGRDGDDRLDGGGGEDVLRGGAGSDVYVVDSAGDTVVEEGKNSGGPWYDNWDVVETSISYVAPSLVEEIRLTGTQTINATGNSLNNYLRGNAARNILDGGAGADDMRGGAGNDIYYVDNRSDSVVENAGDGIDEVRSSIDFTLGEGLETLLLIGSADIDGYGNGVGNKLTGNAGDNRLDGRGGGDTMAGRAGDDTYVVDHSGDEVIESAGGGIDTVESSLSSYTLTAEVENLRLYVSGNSWDTAARNGTGNDLDNTIVGTEGKNTIKGLGGDDELSGGGGNDALDGGTGSDTLDGGTGADTMTGREGDDVYIVDDAGDKVVEVAGGGNDSIVSSISYKLAVEVENLELVGYGNKDAQGNASANRLVGNDWNNILDGGIGADEMIGNGGDDTYTVDNVGDRVVEAPDDGDDTVRSTISYVLGSELENLTLLGSATIDGTGNAAANVLTGNAAANVLKGLAGDDRIDGGAGADTMYGGSGRDVYVVDNAGDKVLEEGKNTSGPWYDNWDIVESSISYTAPALVEEVRLTGTASINATGNSASNYLRGNSARNYLDGRAGSDAMWGGGGSDIYFVDDTGDAVYENADEGTDEVRSSVSFDLGANIENLLLTGSDDIDGRGNDAANKLTGNAGDNRLDGRGGADTMSGKAGDDIYVVDDAGDVVVETAGGGTDTVATSLATYTLGSDLENLVLYVNGYYWEAVGRNGTGNALDNRIEGTDGANKLYGLDGNDTLVGRAGGDTLDGGAGNDVLDGGTGADTMNGRDGDDLYFVDESGDKVVESAGAGNDTVRSTISYKLTTSVENLELIGSGDIDAQGNASANRLVGNDWDNALDGGIGADELIGGRGNDTYTVDNVGDVVVEDAGSGNDTVRSSVTYTLGAEVENLILIGTSAIGGFGNADRNSLTGNSAANVLKGFGGDDRLDGGAGADTLYGGLGRDVYVVDDAADRVIEEGKNDDGPWYDDWDVVEASVGYVAPDLVEEIRLIGTAAIDATGNIQNNYLIGNSGRNILDGREGVDMMWGGAGNDTYIVDNLGDGVHENAGEGTDEVRSSVSFGLTEDVEDLVLIGDDDIDGTGNGSANKLTGNSADNRLDGRGGADTMTGLSGDDTYVVDAVGDVVSEVAGGGIDAVETSLGSYTLTAEVENLYLYVNGMSWETADRNGTGNALDNILAGNDGANTLSGLGGDDTLIGRAGNDTLDGGAGNDTLDGGTGTDTMSGRDGDDIYIVGETGDKVVESAGGGIDTVRATMSYMLAADVENLELVGSGNMDGQGNASANRLVGNNWNNNLDGGIGADVLIGNDGNDTYTVDNSGDLVVEAPGNGTDTVRSTLSWTLGVGLENLTLLGTGNLSATGNELNNRITGNSGANKIYGDFGVDTLNGGAGADTFIWKDCAETAESRWSCDQIEDFSSTQGDKIDLTAIDADVGTAGDQAFAFVGTAAFTAAGQIRYHSDASTTYIELNTDADLNTVEAMIVLNGPITLAATDFKL